MKNQLAQLIILVNKINPRHLQLAYLAFSVAAMFVANKPSDGGVGPI